MRRGTTEARLKQEGKIPPRKERLASSAMSSEKRLGQALIMEGGIQSAGEALGFGWTGCENSVDLSDADRRNVSEKRAKVGRI